MNGDVFFQLFMFLAGSYLVYIGIKRIVSKADFVRGGENKVSGTINCVKVAPAWEEHYALMLGDRYITY
ncbi:MAG: hypothetical protein G01um101456_354 [Parcubacteria group bacterium Gr01-1014_56]|nr:MAG: hypothetical protein G01um101456_354 [Parcubacteria group bacterium Gr01-1014_56]